MSIAGNLPTPYRLAADEEDRCAYRVVGAASVWREARRNLAAAKGPVRGLARRSVNAAAQALEELIAAYDTARAAWEAAAREALETGASS
jgi:hypothetical protein